MTDFVIATHRSIGSILPVRVAARKILRSRRHRFGDRPARIAPTP